MKSIALLCLFVTFSASASPIMTVKERLRLHLWTFGLEEKPVKKAQPRKVLPEEIERPLRKI